MVLQLSVLTADQPLQILKTDYGTHSLKVIDLNGDGRSEILVANRDQGSIDIFEQMDEDSKNITVQNVDNQLNQLDPHSGFRKINIPLNCDIYALAVLDLNGDIRPDLLYHGEPSGLQVQLQLPDGSFDSVIDFNLEPGLDNPWSLLCIPRQHGVEVVLQHQHHRSHLILDSNADQSVFVRLKKEVQIPQSEKENFSWMHWGKWKDGSSGLWVHRTNENQPVSFYRALGECRYDPPIQWKLPQTRMLFPGHFKSQDHFDFIQVRTQQGQLFTLEPRDSDEALKKNRLYSRTIPFSHSRSQNFTCLVADLDQNGSDELVVAHRDSAEVEILEFVNGELTQHQSAPSFRDIQWLGKSEENKVLVFSATEQMTGMSSFKHGELSFPKLQTPEDETVAFISQQGQSIPLKIDVEEQLYLTLQQQKYHIDLHDPWPEKGYAVHLTHQEIPDLVLQIPYQGLKLMTWNVEQKLYVNLLPSLPFFDEDTLQDLHLGSLQFLPGKEGQMDMTLSQGRLLRRYRFFPEPTIVSQVNLPKVGSISSAHLICQLFPDSKPTLVSLDRDRSELDFFIQQEESFVWHSRHRCHIQQIDELLELKSPHGSSLICRGKGEAEWIQFGTDHQHKTPLTRSLSQKEESWQFFERAEPIRLESGMDLALIYDSEKSTYNFFRFEEQDFKRIMSFPVLERKSFRDSDDSAGNLRHVLAAPLSEYGKHAIVSLIDDRVLIYRR